MRFTVRIKNVPSGTAYWSVACYWNPPQTGNEAYSPVLGISQPYTFTGIPTNEVYFWERCFDSQKMQIAYYGTPFTVLKDGGDYTIDFQTGTVTETTPSEGEFNFTDLLPMFPWEGPPLPRVTGLTWEKIFGGFEFEIPLSK